MPNITFRALDKYSYDVCLPPIPASKKIPDWWRNARPYSVSPENPDGSKLIVENRVSNASFKKCTPMLDGITSGYIIELWADVQVKQTDFGPVINWRTHKDVFTLHGEDSRYIPAPPSYSNVVFKYLNPWIPITPDGYSVMITPPSGFSDLPFRAIPAVLDSDKSRLEIVNPCWVKKDFEGIVEKGTPIMQITPFKRESWTSELDYYPDDEHMKVNDRNFNGTIVSHYIKNVWSKKSYK